MGGEAMGGEAMGGEAVEYTGEYVPESPLNALNEEGQRAFCDSSIMRNEAAALEGDELNQFITNSCLLASILQSSDPASCEAAIPTCEMELRDLIVTSDQCLTDRLDQFASCAASVSEIENCEDAIRDRAYQSLLNFNFLVFKSGPNLSFALWSQSFLWHHQTTSLYYP